MAEQLDLSTFTGAHPTNGEFVAQLQAWGFTQRRIDGCHLVLRGPHGGTVRVLRSPIGRADAALVDKAARLAGVDVERFWAGPAATTPAAATADQPAAPEQPRRAPAARDRIVSLVLAAYTSTDRPLGFDQVVRLCRGQVTRDQVRTASATLCRDGQLDRVRSGVYRWAGDTHEQPHSAPPRALHVPAPRRSTPSAATHPRNLPPGPATEITADPSAAALFEQLFPAGVQMTAELLTDFEQWTRLTAKLAAYANAS